MEDSCPTKPIRGKYKFSEAVNNGGAESIKEIFKFVQGKLDGEDNFRDGDELMCIKIINAGMI